MVRRPVAAARLPYVVAVAVTDRACRMLVSAVHCGFGGELPGRILTINLPRAAYPTARVAGCGPHVGQSGEA